MLKSLLIGDKNEENQKKVSLSYSSSLLAEYSSSVNSSSFIFGDESSYKSDMMFFDDETCNENSQSFLSYFRDNNTNHIVNENNIIKSPNFVFQDISSFLKMNEYKEDIEKLEDEKFRLQYKIVLQDIIILAQKKLIEKMQYPHDMWLSFTDTFLK